VLLAASLADEIFVLGRTAGVFARLDDQLAIGAELGLAVTECLLVESGDGEVPVNLRTAEAEVGEVVAESFVDLFGKRKNAKPSGGRTDGFPAREGSTLS